MSMHDIRPPLSREISRVREKTRLYWHDFGIFVHKSRFALPIAILVLLFILGTSISALNSSQVKEARAFPEFVSGTWEHRNGVKELELSESAEFKEFNSANSAYNDPFYKSLNPLGAEAAPEPIPTSSTSSEAATSSEASSTSFILPFGNLWQALVPPAIAQEEDPPAGGPPPAPESAPSPSPEPTSLAAPTSAPEPAAPSESVSEAAPAPAPTATSSSGTPSLLAPTSSEGATSGSVILPVIDGEAATGTVTTTSEASEGAREPEYTVFTARREMLLKNFVFDAAPDASATIQFITLNLSLMAEGAPGNRDRLVIDVSPDGNIWETLKELTLNENHSNYLHGGYFAYTLPYKTLEELQNVEVRITSLSNKTIPQPIFIDAAWLNIRYAVQRDLLDFIHPEAEEELSPEELAKLPRVKIPGAEIFELEKNDFLSDETPEVNVNLKKLGDLVAPREDQVPTSSEPQGEAMRSLPVTPASPSVSENTTPDTMPPPAAPQGELQVPRAPVPSSSPEVATSTELETPSYFPQPFGIFNNVVFAQARTAAPAGAARGRVVGAKLFDPYGTVTDITDAGEATGTNSVAFAVPKPGKTFRPGTYRMEAELLYKNKIYIAEQEFTWGAFAVNINTSGLSSGDSISLYLAVLDDWGNAICDANLELEITDPRGGTQLFSHENGEIGSSGECGGDAVTETTDYFVLYTVADPGSYAFRVTNLNTGRGAHGSFQVKPRELFTIERKGPTRLVPGVTYEMELIVTATQDFEGDAVEYLPANFFVTGAEVRQDSDGAQVIRWPLSLKTGETSTLTYSFVAPDNSPALSLLGPVSFIPASFIGSLGEWVGIRQNSLFSESRQWQIVVNDNVMYLKVAIVGTGTSPDPFRPDVARGIRFSALIPTDHKGVPIRNDAIIAIPPAELAKINQENIVQIYDRTEAKAELILRNDNLEFLKIKFRKTP